VAGITGFDPRSKARVDELREEMTRASKESPRTRHACRTAEREGIAPQVRNFVLQAEQVG
jgi:hypothetical protein